VGIEAKSDAIFILSLIFIIFLNTGRFSDALWSKCCQFFIEYYSFFASNSNNGDVEGMATGMVEQIDSFKA
jgi:hypothetical protein